MIEHGLREGLTGSVTSEIGVETERLHDREVSLDSEHGCSRPLLFAEHLSTTLVQARVDTADAVFWTLDFDYTRCVSLSLLENCDKRLTEIDRFLQ